MHCNTEEHLIFLNCKPVKKSFELHCDGVFGAIFNRRVRYHEATESLALEWLAFVIIYYISNYFALF